eukprot:9466074-Pyramimonas_sp.AAC.1
MGLHCIPSGQTAIGPLMPDRCLSGRDTVETHAKRHPACLQGALGFFGVDGFAVEGVTLPRRENPWTSW